MSDLVAKIAFRSAKFAGSMRLDAGRSNVCGRCALAALLLCCASSASADVIFYNIPRTNLVVVLQGKTTANPGRTLTYRHPKFGNLVFALEDTRVVQAPTVESQFASRLGKAVSARDADAAMEAGRWALKHGLVESCYKAAAEALKLDPRHVAAGHVRDLYRRIRTPLPASPEEEQRLRAMVPKSGMKIKRSAHFMMLHDTPDKPERNQRHPRADERLALLEQVYESFLLQFYSQGVELEPPEHHLQVVLFNNYNEYLLFAKSWSPELASAAGFWNSQKNVSVFYDHASSERFRVLKQLSDQLQELKADAIRNKTSASRDTVRLADTLSLLMEVERENADIEVVSHETTHQMAGNTGLLPRNVVIPTWVHEGLATYFESPDDAAWAGIGAVNEERLQWYRELEPERRISNIDFIVGNQIFSLAASHGAKLHAYGQAWALTHFLVERHFDKYMTFCRRLGEMPPDVPLNADLLTALFDEAFGKDRDHLDAEWRLYMRSLKTDLETIRED